MTGGRSALGIPTLHSSSSFILVGGHLTADPWLKAIAKTTAEPVNQAHFRRRMAFWRGTTPKYGEIRARRANHGWESPVEKPFIPEFRVQVEHMIRQQHAFPISQ